MHFLSVLCCGVLCLCSMCVFGPQISNLRVPAASTPHIHYTFNFTCTFFAWMQVLLKSCCKIKKKNSSGKLVRNVLNVCQKCTEHFLPTCCTVTFFTCKEVLCRRLVANSYGNFLLEIYDSVVANSFCKCPMNVAANLCQISHFLVLWCLSCYTN